YIADPVAAGLQHGTTMPAERRAGAAPLRERRLQGAGHGPGLGQQWQQHTLRQRLVARHMVERGGNDLGAGVAIDKWRPQWGETMSPADEQRQFQGVATLRDGEREQAEEPARLTAGPHQYGLDAAA